MNAAPRRTIEPVYRTIGFPDSSAVTARSAKPTVDQTPPAKSKSARRPTYAASRRFPHTAAVASAIAATIGTTDQRALEYRTSKESRIASPSRPLSKEPGAPDGMSCVEAQTRHGTIASPTASDAIASRGQWRRCTATKVTRSTLAAMNPDVDIVPLAQRVGAGEVDALVAQADVVLDCSDNFATRHLLNRACVEFSRPLISGAAIRFDGQLMVFDLRRKDAPCYACLFPEEGEVEEVQCNVMGVLAPLTGTIGAMQAVEAVKLLSGAGETPAGQLTLFDAKRSQLRTVNVKKDPRCAVCGAR